MKAFKCPECGGSVRPYREAGRMRRYYTMRLEVPESIAVPTCDKCKEEWIDKKTGDAIDEALDKVYRASLREKARNAVAAISPHVKQFELEEMLGVSVGYLSKVKAGTKDVSPRFVALLSLIANSPSARLSELASVWGPEGVTRMMGRKVGK